MKGTTARPYTTDTVLSKDGTTIGYRRYGHGPAIVLLQGGMGSAQNFAQLAEALADSFTVYVPDRRGRGMSPYGREYSVQEDIDDLGAVLEKSGAHNVFGLSTGGLIVLKAASSLPAIRKIAIYEPALSVNGSTPLEWAARYEREMAQGKFAAALVTAMLGPQMGPPIARYTPRPLLVLFAKWLLAQEDKNGSGDYLPMRELLPTLHHDAQLLAQMSGTIDSFRTLLLEVLMLNGADSPAFQRFSVACLAKVLPHVRRVEFPGLDHAGAWNYDKQRNPGGRPTIVANELRRFFIGPAEGASPGPDCARRE